MKFPSSRGSFAAGTDRFAYCYLVFKINIFLKSITCFYAVSEEKILYIQVRFKLLKLLSSGFIVIFLKTEVV